MHLIKGFTVLPHITHPLPLRSTVHTQLRLSARFWDGAQGSAYFVSRRPGLLARSIWFFELVGRDSVHLMLELWPASMAG